MEGNGREDGDGDGNWIEWMYVCMNKNVYKIIGFGF